MSLVDRFFTWVVIAAVVLGVGFMALLRPAHSQAVVKLCFPPASAVGNSCIDVTAANPLPVNATVSISGFAPSTTGTPISVTASAGGVTGTLPAGAVVVASNVGTTNTAYCKLGATSTTSDQPITPNGGWFAFTVGAATQLTCITSTSTTTVNMVGGSGLPTGTGGGGGGSGGGGAVTVADGADVTQGALADAACATDNGSCTVAALVKRNNQRLTTVIAGIPVTNAGTFATQSAVTAASGSYSSGAIAAGAQVDLLTMRGTKNAGTAAANSMQVGGVYNSTPLTLTDTQQASLQFDANGYLKVNTAAGAAAGGTSSNFGSAFPTPGTAIGFSDGTNMVAAKVGAVANVAAATNMVNTLAIAQYNATPLTVTDTRYQSLQSDVNGNLRTATPNGANITLGAIADSAYSGSGSCTNIACLKGIYAALTGSLPAGSNTIGNTIPAPTSSSSLALTHAVCGSAVSSCVLKNAAGNLYGVYAECSAACWLMLFNATSAPSNGATTAGTASGNMVECIAIPANDQRSLNYPTFPIALSVGITAAISSTACATLTLATTGFVHGTVQ